MCQRRCAKEGVSKRVCEIWCAKEGVSTRTNFDFKEIPRVQTVPYIEQKLTKAGISISLDTITKMPQTQVNGEIKRKEDYFIHSSHIYLEIV